jgi:hypothetical protein
MGDAQLYIHIVEFIRMLNATERWLEQYGGHGQHSPSEAQAVQSLRRYIAKSRVYCGDPKAKQDELVHRRKKIERACWKLTKAWFEKGRQ